MSKQNKQELISSPERLEVSWRVREPAEQAGVAVAVRGARVSLARSSGCILRRELDVAITAEQALGRGGSEDGWMGVSLRVGGLRGWVYECMWWLM